MTHEDAEASEDVAEGMIFISGLLVRCLFDFGSTHSFIFPSFAQNLHIVLVQMDIILSMATPLGVSMQRDFVYRGCVVQIRDKEISIDLIQLRCKTLMLFFGWIG